MKYLTNKQKSCFLAFISAAMVLMLLSTACAAPFAHIENNSNKMVSLPYLVNNTITATISVGENPTGVVISSDGTKVYVLNSGSNSVSVINVAKNTVVATMSVGLYPMAITIDSDGKKVYVLSTENVSVIDTSTNTVTATVSVGQDPLDFTIIPDGTKVYTTNHDDNSVSVIDTATNTVTATVNVGNAPQSLGQFIGKTAPAITWNNPIDIVYGTALSNTQLDATSSIPGSFTYNPPSGTVLSAGQNQQLNTTFTPNDNVNYTQANATVLINVTQATPAITWKNPTDLVYGTKLSSSQLNAISSVSGICSYNPPLGTVLSVGTHTLTTSFKPTDTIDYTTASATASINAITPVQEINQMTTSIQN